MNLYQMHTLGYENKFLNERGAFHTAHEIESQPSLWLNVYRNLLENNQRLNKFLITALAESDKIMLTGAGTSAYIGLSLQGIFSRNLGKITMAVATTDLVTHPADYFFNRETVLLVSFARSGNSPESSAAVELADKLCKKVYHLIITCDESGHLALLTSSGPRYIIVLPPESNDQSLAMTGSYSGMLLSGLLVTHLQKLEQLEANIQMLHLYGTRILETYAPILQNISEMNFTRAVFLGSGPFYGTATESSLKLQELTDGRIICKNDTFLGLRHGPKAVIDENTLLMFIFSDNPYVLRYERDLVASMRKGKKPLFTIGLSENGIPGCNFDLPIQLSVTGANTGDEFLTVCNILPGQLLGFYKSLSFGLKPDNPSVSGAITRVVEDVKIYQY
jgi:tagatose-6-phosphate ketose/aldose isomerase